MNNGFESLAGSCIGVNKGAHFVPVHGTGGRYEIGTKFDNDQWQSFATGCRQIAGDGVGINHGGAPVSQQLGDGAFAAADAAGQSQSDKG
jgi:hypothetical protein